MIKIAIIVPGDLLEIAKTAARELQENITILEGSMGKGVQLAKNLENQGYEVIIARGGTEILLKKSGLKIPTVALPITPMDILKAMREVNTFGKSAAILAFHNILPAVESYEEIVGERLEKYLVKNEKEVEEKMQQIQKRGISLVVGGGIITQYASQYNIQPIVIKTGKEVFIGAIEEAKRMAVAMRNEKERSEKFKAVIEYAHDGIISVDRKETINIFNPAAEKLLNIKCNTALEQPIRKIIPQLRIDGLLKQEIYESESIETINGRKIICNRIPVLVSGDILGALIILQDIGRIQEIEEKIRREIVTSGHYARYNFKDVLGYSEEIQEVIRIAKEYAKVNATVLIQGETGTGKEIMAQSIHNESDRRDKPFVAVNCAALPESLLESELFGYAPGAFTGADSKGKRGLFEIAHGGTLFLDEISEMHPSLQGRLLRVIQEKQVMKIGDNKLIPIDIRIIVASNKNLKKLIKQGEFREDLYFRLNILELSMIPLRRRQKDIPYYLEHFIASFSSRLEKPMLKLEADAVSYLCEYYWPGNVRELRNFTERLVIMAKKINITLKDINVLSVATTELNEEDKYKYEIKYDTVGNSSESQRIQKTLHFCDWNITKTAQQLGVSRTTLWRKMKKYRIKN